MSDPSNCTEIVLFDSNPLPIVSTVHQSLLSQTNAFFKEEVPYVGLSNQGATCYMNSLLQTLFMTPEFRKGIYSWEYDKSKHSKEEDCIPFQLQKLFAKLQTKFSHYIETKELTKSFQWNAGESFEQQDIQEFCRVLFDAIEQTCKKSKAESLISDLYEGSSINYVKCLECSYESQRQESFLDVCLTVKNKIDKIYNDSLEKALQIYLKPELLQGSNQYFCEKCNKKVDAQRGTRFFKLPRCLCLILNRFSFDYFLFKRIKLEDFVSFPFVLNFNNYINGYEHIKNKYSEEIDPNYFENEQPIPKNPVKKTVVFKQPQPKIVLPTKRPSKTNSSAQTKNFLKEIRTKTNKTAEKNEDFVVVVNDHKEKNEHPASQGSNSQSNNVSEKSSAINSSTSTQKVKEKSKKPVVFDLEEECISIENTNNDGDALINMEQTPGNPQKIKEEAKKAEIPNPERQAEQILDAEKQAFEQMKKTRAENLDRIKKETHSLIQQYLQEGPLVYELYSILNHSGGAYGGHYFNFTRSFEDNKWYHFDDTCVREIDVEEISTKTFGGSNKSSTAYMLMYRQVDAAKPGAEAEKGEIPAYIQAILSAERLEQQRLYEEKCELLKQLTVKVYYKLEVKYIPIRTNNTYSELLAEVMNVYNVKTDKNNCRLRVYAPQTDTLLDTFHGKDDETLETLKINNYKTFALEIKKDHEVFEPFDESKTSLRLVLWTPQVSLCESLGEYCNSVENYKKLQCFKHSTLQEIHDEAGKVFAISPEKLVIYKKVVTSGISVAQLLTNAEKMGRTLLELVLMENSLLFVEELAESQEKSTVCSKWQEEFDKEANRFVIKHNNPAQKELVLRDSSQENDEYQYSVVIDARQTLFELKYKICSNLGLDPNEILMKRGGKLGIEIKDLNSVIATQHFISGSSVFLEFGKPSIPGQFRVVFFWAKPTELCNDNYFFTFEEIMELPVPGEFTASKVKSLILDKLHETQGKSFNPDYIRLRERNSEKLTRIYREIPMISQQIFERRMMALEEIATPDFLGPKDVVLYVRVWDSQKFELSPRFELKINKDGSLAELAREIAKRNSEIPAENMIACRILSIARFNPMSLLSEEWFAMNTEEMTCSSHPFYLNNDGYLLIIKDLTVPFRELTEEEVKKYGITQRKHEKIKVDFSVLSKKPVEKALKIHIKSKEDEEKEQIQ